MKALTAALFLTAASCLHAQAAGPLSIKVPDGWKVDYGAQQGVEFYSITAGGQERPLLLALTRWPMPGGRELIPQFMPQLAEAFLGEVRKNPQVKLTSPQPEPLKISGTTFSGEGVLFRLEGGMVQTLFMVAADKTLWNGQFTGPEERWQEALATLKAMGKAD